MKNTTHTPAPWHIEKHNKVVWQDSGGPGNTTYATSYPITLIVHEQLGDPRLRNCVAQLDNSTESEDNARLIAAAPELLEACKTLLSRLHVHTAHVEACDLHEPDELAINSAEVAISKAEGK